jgi:hypothetical protein
MNAFDFAKQIILACSKYNFIQGIEIQLIDEPVVKIKAVIDSVTFISIFHNAETQKYSFPLIKSDQRIFGADNSKKWHLHPFENPGYHNEISQMTLPEFLEMLSTNKDKWQ